MTGASSGQCGVGRDASSEDWATIAVRVLSIALVPRRRRRRDGVDAPGQAPYVNLEQLTRSRNSRQRQCAGGTLQRRGSHLSANPGTWMLTVSQFRETGFPVAAGNTIASNLIQISGQAGSAGSLPVPLQVTFDPLTVTRQQRTALDLSSISRTRRY